MEQKKKSDILSNEFIVSEVHGGLNRSGSRAKSHANFASDPLRFIPP